MATDLLPTLVTLAALGGIVWKAAKLEGNLKDSIEAASISSDKAITNASQKSLEEINRSNELVKKGQEQIKAKFNEQFNQLQHQNAERYRDLNQSLQLHLKDFKYEVELRQRTEETYQKELEALKTEFYKVLAERDKIIENLQKRCNDLTGFLQKNQGFVDRER